jgi:hypothetical protein
VFAAVGSPLCAGAGDPEPGVLAPEEPEGVELEVVVPVVVVAGALTSMVALG